MGHIAKAIACAAAAAAVMASTPAQAARCWNSTNADALAVKHLDTMLMVQTLRCQLINADVAAHYNSFVDQNRPLLAAANQRVQDHFAVQNGRADALNQYDQLVVSIANGFGGGHEDMDCHGVAELLTELSAPTDQQRLLELANATVGHPRQTTPRCDSRMAARP